MPGPLLFVVDDEPAIASTLEIILREENYTAVGFSDPEAALAAASAVQPDLLLSDFLMPGMDGLTLATELQRRCPNCKVLMFSAASNLASKHPAWHRFEFLDKPLPMPMLLAHLKAALGRGNN
jgi:DNA-binding NtrC family response regulator